MFSKFKTPSSVIAIGSIFGTVLDWTESGRAPDKKPSRFLKDYGTSLAPSLTPIFKASLSQGKLLLDWKYATIVPAHKKGDCKCPCNYRPILLTCKLLEHIIYSQVSTHWKHHDVVCDEQHGFQQGKSCESQLIYTINDFVNSLNKGEEVDFRLF